MGYSIRDLDDAARGISQRLEARSQQQGEALANRVMASTAQGRGLWVLLLWPVWVLIFSFSGGLFVSLLHNKVGVNLLRAYLGFVGAFLFARAWYRSDFTIRHPFWSSMITNFGTAIGAATLAGKLGL